MPSVNPLVLGDFGVLLLVVFALLGLIMGSFSSAMIHRLPSGVGVFSPGQRSACPYCNHTLGVRDLIPLFSWLFSRGRCRYCSASIPALYPFLELSAALLAISIFIFCPAKDMMQSFIVLAMLPFLLALLMIDIRHKTLPNILVAIIFMLGLTSLAYQVYLEPGTMKGRIVEHLGGALVYMTLAWLLAAGMTKILKKQALGMGDVKFFAVAGLWLGLGDLGIFCILGGIFGVLFGVAWQKIKNEALFPFGPALIVSFFILLLMGGSHSL